MPAPVLVFKKTGRVGLLSLQTLALRTSHLERSHHVVRSPSHRERAHEGAPGNSPSRAPSLQPASTANQCQLLAGVYTILDTQPS